MKIESVFRVFLALALVAGISLPAAAQDRSEAEQELEQELRWLHEEAMATTVSVATRTEMGVNEAPSIVSVITEEQIRNSGAKDLEEVLRQVAGFYLYKNVIFPSVNLYIRGLGELANPSVKIMVNGHSLEVPVEQNIGWVISFPVDVIKKIEIIRGPGSALYGNAAMNGVINIITKDGRDPSAISASYGSFDSYKGTAQLAYSRDDLNLFLYAESGGSDGDPQWIESDAAPGASHAPGYSNEAFKCNNFFTKLSYKDFYLTGFLKDDEREPPVGIANALTDESEVPDKAAFVEAGYNGDITDNVRLWVKGYYDYMVMDLRYEFFNEETAAALFGLPKDQGVLSNFFCEVDKYGVEATTSFDIKESLEIVAGGLWEYTETRDSNYEMNVNLFTWDLVFDDGEYGPGEYLGGMRNVIPCHNPVSGENDSNFIYEDKAKRNVYAGYLQGTWDMMKSFPSWKGIGKNLTLTTGIRYDYYDNIGDTLNPRAGIVYAPNEKLFFKLLYGQAFRAPGLNEMYFKNNSAVNGNPDLEPETIKTAEILAGVNLTDRITATLDFFHIRKENAIRHYNTKYSNWGEIESRGAEGEIRASLDKDKYGYFNITFQKATDITDDPEKERIVDTGGAEYIQEDYDFGMYPRITANLGINCNITKYVNANLSVSHIASIQRIGNKHFTPEDTDPDGTVEKVDQREEVDDYTLVNLSLIFRNFDFAPGWEFQLTGYNIFNDNHRDPSDNPAVEDDLPRWDRHFMGKVTYSF